jgi:integrase
MLSIRGVLADLACTQMDGTRFLEDGKLTIVKRSGTYYARLRISHKYVWRSLKTSNEAIAIALGRRLLFQIEQRDEHGLPPKSKKFSKVIDEYVRYRERHHAHGKTSAGRDYYSKFKKRPQNAKRHPTDKTLQWDMMLGKAIVRRARGLRGNKSAITVTFTPKKKRVRPAFEQREYRRLWRTLLSRVNSAKNLRARLSRELLRYYVLVLANSGLRPGEANALRLNDVHAFRDERGRKNYRLVVRGKTGERDVILRSVAAKRLDKYLTKRRVEDPQGFLFVMPMAPR